MMTIEKFLSQGADQFNHLLDRVLPNGGYVMTLFEAFFDESGTDADQQVLAVGGYMTSATHARMMDAKWRDVLRRAGIPHFHMKDCAPCPPNGVCKDLSCDQCDRLARKLMALIQRYSLFGCVAFANAKSVIKEHHLDLYGRCLFLSVTQFYKLINDRRESYESPKLQCFFERGHATAAAAARYLEGFMKHADKQELLSGYSFQTKEDMPLLQAADFLVWQARKYLADHLSKKRKPRRDFQELVKDRHLFVWTNFDEHGWTFWVNGSPLDPDPKRDSMIEVAFSDKPWRRLGPFEFR
jgi:hypothetical protein